MCLKDNCQGFQKTPLEIMPGVPLPIFLYPNAKVLALPQLPLECMKCSDSNDESFLYLFTLIEEK